jgi:signal peptidase II
VVDFFQILQFPVFNFADVAQIAGIILVIWSWKTELNFHLPLDNKRTFSPFNRSLDVRFTIQLFILFLCSSMIIFSFSYLFIKYTLIETGLASGFYLEEHLQAYVIMFSSFIFLMAIVILIISSLISRRIIGPIYAMEKYLDDTLEGKEYPFQLREKDHFRNLESKLTLMNKRMKKP